MRNPCIFPPLGRLFVHKRQIIFLAFAFFLMSATVFAQEGAPYVFVSSKTAGKVIAVNTASPAYQKVILGTGGDVSIPPPGASKVEGMTFGPDSSLYVCDPTEDVIYRVTFNLTNGAPTTDITTGLPTAAAASVFYNGASAGPTGLHHAQCGRFSANGNFHVTSEDPSTGGSGVWVFSCIAPVVSLDGTKTPPCTPSFPPTPPPTQVFSASLVGTNTQGITQSKAGNLLVVDQTDGKVWQSLLDSTTLTFSTPPTALITGLATPVGIARTSTGQILVVEQTGTNQGDLRLFTPSTSILSTCVSSALFAGKPNFAAISAGDTSYVTTSGPGPNKGTLYKVTPGCTATQVGSTLSFSLDGIALPPTETSRAATTAFSSHIFDFGFSAFQVGNVVNCTASVIQTQSPQGSPLPTPTGIESLISSITNASGLTPPIDNTQISPVPNLGEAGFDTLYTAAPSCAAVDSSGVRVAVSGIISGLTNPRLVSCDGEPLSCAIRNAVGFYPVGLIGDPVIIVGGGGLSQWFWVNLPLTTNPTELGQFCGFQSPFNQSPATFSSGQNASVKFKLAQSSGNCQNGPFITDAVALLSVARIADASGNPVFVPCTSDEPTCPLSPSGSSEISPTFDLNTKNKQYNFSLSLKGYAPGTYTLNVLFLTNNANTVTTQFIVQ